MPRRSSRADPTELVLPLLRPLRALVADVAASVARAQPRLRAADVVRKGVGDFVTTIDVRAERRLRRELTRLLPEAGFLGEESRPEILHRDWVWVVDPIDGTSNFARGLPHFAVAVALLHQGRPWLACTHSQPYGVVHSAVAGRGSWRNGRRVTAPAGRFDDGAIVGCQWFRGQQDMAFVAHLQQRGARIRTLGSTVTQIVDVVDGRLDGNVQQQGRVWDLAAVGLIAVEAGLCATDWSGRELFPFADLAVEHTATVVAPPGVHRHLLRALRR